MATSIRFPQRRRMAALRQTFEHRVSPWARTRATSSLDSWLSLGSIASSRSLGCIASLRSAGSIASAWSAGSLASAASVGSVGSVLSVGSAASLLSVGSAGSLLSVGSTNSLLSVNASGGILTIGRAPQPDAGDEVSGDQATLAVTSSASPPGRTVDRLVTLATVAALIRAVLAR
jgi:hypothetical protein